MSRLIVSHLIASAFLAVCVCPVLAQQITGQVRYVDTGQAAFNVIVKCDGTGVRSEVFTDRSGNFRFSVTPGHYTVSIHMPGYIAEERSVDLVDNNSSEYFFFRLKPDRAGTKPPDSNLTTDPNVPPAAQKEFEKAQAILSDSKKGDIEESVRHLEKALEIYPKFLEAQLRLGTAYMDLEEWDKAEQSLRKTLEIDPKAANALFALGEIYLQKKKDEDAEKVLLQGLQLAEGSYQGHLTLGRAYWEMATKAKEDVKARPFLEKAYDQVNQALTLKPDLAGGHLLKGNLLLKVRRAKDAQTEFEEYLRLEPNGQFAQQTRVIVEKIKKVLESQSK